MPFPHHRIAPQSDRRLLRLLLTLAAGLLLFGALGIAAAQDTTTPVVPPPLSTVTPTPIPRPLPTNVLTQERATLEFYFATLAQGQTGLMRITGEGIAGARARFLNNLTDFFAVDGDGFYGLLSTSMEQTPRQYDLDIFVWYADETRQTINTQIEVVLGQFIRQTVTIPPDKAYLVDPETERDELARLEGIFSPVTPQKRWDNTGFALPIPGGELTSPFGAFRNFNESVETRHTGWDVQATLGQPILASAAGTVAYAGLLQIRGNCVVIDHGDGVYTTYSHLQQIHVTRGQTITKGQVLGIVGNTGRTSGPHFHWEVAVNGTFVDATQFMGLWLP
jgi:murein DD-endopeptidase MepM/ murein hydrolase activator NlpD